MNNYEFIELKKKPEEFGISCLLKAKSSHDFIVFQKELFAFRRGFLCSSLIGESVCEILACTAN